MKRVGTIRIGNIAVITSKSLKDVEYYDIVKYYPNEYYGKEDEYVLIADDMYCHKDDTNLRYRVHKSCFAHKECCYSIAHINDVDDCEIVSVGSRMIELSKQEWLDLKDVLDVFYRKYKELNSQDE